MYKFGSRSIKRMEGVDQALVDVAVRALEISSNRIDGIDFTIPKYGGLRTAKDQKKLFDRGASRADGVTNKSRHQLGKALDVIAYVDGSASFEDEHLHKVAVCMLQAANELNVKLEWGGHWKTFKDLPHYQIK